MFVDRVLVLSLCKESGILCLWTECLYCHCKESGILCLWTECLYCHFVRKAAIFCLFKLLIFVVSVQFSAHSVIGLFNCLWY